MGFLLFLVFYEEKILMGVGRFQIFSVLVWVEAFWFDVVGSIGSSFLWGWRPISSHRLALPFLVCIAVQVVPILILCPLRNLLLFRTISRPRFVILSLLCAGFIWIEE